MREYQFYVYILTNATNKVLYTGVTNNLVARIEAHKKAKPGSFTARYKVTKLVYFEFFKYINNAIAREKQLKAGSRKKKVELIERVNKEWKELSPFTLPAALP